MSPLPLAQTKFSAETCAEPLAEGKSKDQTDTPWLHRVFSEPEKREITTIISIYVKEDIK